MIGVYILLSILIALCIAVLIVVLTRKQNMDEVTRPISDLQIQFAATVKSQTESTGSAINNMQQMVLDQVAQIRQDNTQTLNSVMQSTAEMHKQNIDNIHGFDKTLRDELHDMRIEMQKQLDEMRDTVDEQLQTNLEKKLQESFRTVSERLEAVHRGLGEMQTLASNVGDLKKTLSNVKTRGIWGEIQLGVILGEILTPAQYDTNVVTVPHTLNRVEYAIKLPGDKNNTVYLPIDSKFPGDAYNKLLDAYDSGSSSVVDAAWKDLEKTLTSEARDIHDKYIAPPYTTEFGIMFLPVEGLYAEAVKHGMVEKLQNMYKINIAGPTTMGALLNSLQMGFKTLQIQKQSGEVWRTLQEVRTEFEKYTDVLQKAQNRLKQTQDEIETLVGVRTRQISSKLSQIDRYDGNALSDGGSL